MRALLFVTRNREEAVALLKNHGIVTVEENPGIVITYGGDGALMKSEHIYPGVPKLILRASLVCKKCPPYTNDEILELFKKGKYEIEELMKIEAARGDEKLAGMNEVNLHNANPRHAIRYRYAINGIEHPHEIIGDGVILATPFGSSAYYRSITKSAFQKGIGLAFNNSTEPFDHMVLEEDAVISIKITRGPAIAFADNQPDEILLKDGDVLEIKKSPQLAKVIML